MTVSKRIGSSMTTSARKSEASLKGCRELSLATQDDMLGEVFEYLQDWWKVHITHEDRKYVEFEQKNGLIPEEA